MAPSARNDIGAQDGTTDAASPVMRTHGLPRLASFAFLASLAALVACSAGESVGIQDGPEAEDGESEGALVTGTAKTVAVTIGSGSDARTIAAPEKVKRVLDAITPGKPTATCESAPDALSLELLGADGKSVGSVKGTCAGYGTMRSGGKTTTVRFNATPVKAVAKMPRTAGDFLWGPNKVTEIELSQTVPPHTDRKTVKAKGDIEDILAAFVEDDDAKATCSYTEPHYGLTFHAGSKDVGSGGTSCRSATLTLGSEPMTKFAVTAATLKRFF